MSRKLAAPWPRLEYCRPVVALAMAIQMRTFAMKKAKIEDQADLVGDAKLPNPPVPTPSTLAMESGPCLKASMSVQRTRCCVRAV